MHRCRRRWWRAWCVAWALLWAVGSVAWIARSRPIDNYFAPRWATTATLEGDDLYAIAANAAEITADWRVRENGEPPELALENGYRAQFSMQNIVANRMIRAQVAVLFATMCGLFAFCALLTWGLSEIYWKQADTQNATIRLLIEQEKANKIAFMRVPGAVVDLTPYWDR